MVPPAGSPKLVRQRAVYSWESSRRRRLAEHDNKKGHKASGRVEFVDDAAVRLMKQRFELSDTLSKLDYTPNPIR